MSDAPALLINSVGTIAAISSMSSFVPQILKIIKDRDATGVSLKMFAVTVTGFVLWTIYGVLSQSWPVAASNAVCLVLSGIVVGLRLYFGDGPDAEDKSRSSGDKTKQRLKTRASRSI